MVTPQSELSEWSTYKVRERKKQNEQKCQLLLRQSILKLHRGKIARKCILSCGSRLSNPNFRIYFCPRSLDIFYIRTIDIYDSNLIYKMGQGLKTSWIYSIPYPCLKRIMVHSRLITQWVSLNSGVHLENLVNFQSLFSIFPTIHLYHFS